MIPRPLAPALALALSSLAHAQPLTTAFTYQGQLTTSGAPASGQYDMRFRLYDALTAGAQLGPTLCADNVAVAQGQFTTRLDFGAQFAGQQRFLELDIRQDTGLSCANAAGFTTLTTRQPLSATPNAAFAITAATALDTTQLGGQPAAYYTNAAHLVGALPSTSLFGTYTSALNLTNTSNTFTGSFSGSGAALTGVPWSAITGAPNPVLLQGGLGGTQVGFLNVSDGNFYRLNVATLAPGADPIKFGGTVRLLASGGDGDALRVGPDNRKLGFTTESSQQILNFDMNFRFTGTDIFNPGAAIRLDGRVTSPPIQFLTRLHGSNTEITAMQIGEAGNVAIGTAPSPSIRLNILDNVSGGSALYSQSNAADGYAGAFRGYGPDVVSIVNFGSGRGLFIQSSNDTALWANSTNGMGIDARTVNSTAVGGYASADTGSTTGVAGTSASTGGRGVLGSATASTGTTHGVHGECFSSSGTAIAGYEWSTTGVTFGGYTQVSSPAGRGFFGQVVPNSGVNYGVVGATNSAAGYGVYSAGTLGASGAKPFRIDHPDDPAHKYLLHYSTESPEVINFYRGTVTLNEQGQATVDLPPYFAKINKDPSYQLTALGAPMPMLHVSSRISSAALEEGAAAAPADEAPVCSFTISGGAPRGEVCWRVEAIRNDRWVQAHGAPVELLKEGPEDGTYQHPDLYNQPPELATFRHEPAR
jgi:hypothetical protein